MSSMSFLSMVRLFSALARSSSSSSSNTCEIVTQSAEELVARMEEEEEDDRDDENDKFVIDDEKMDDCDKMETVAALLSLSETSRSPVSSPEKPLITLLPAHSPDTEHVVCGRCGHELVPLEPHTCPTSKPTPTSLPTPASVADSGPVVSPSSISSSFSFLAE